MTREEAKEILTHNWTRVDNPNYSELELDEAFFMAIEALSAEPKTGEWIPCSERLPEKDEEVLITAWGRVEGVAWVDKYGLWQTETYTFHNNEDVTAWMPLPEPYKGGDEE